MQLAKKANLKEKSKSDSQDLPHSIRLVSILVGGLLCAIAINGFFIPNQLLSGGASGIAIMAHYLTGLPTGLLIFLINIPIFAVGFKIVDRDFVFYSFISMFAMSLLLNFTEGIGSYIQVNDLLLESVFGGVLNGIGMGMMFRNKASQGGMDIIAAILKKKLNMNIGSALMGVNIVVVGISSVLFGIRPAMYTLMGLYIAYKILDKVQAGLDTNQSVMLISNKPDEVAKEIFEQLGRGATFLKGEGAYTRDNKKVIYCTVTSTQVGKLKEIVKGIDEDAFINISDSKEVKGRGFRNIEF
ncbi:YitT family protein [Clostridium sp. D2Q-11]|uniref:YitT family protein n=1 Tax=Anaeromonas frigoriresistens TaxID=2683708 RepID=A0A942Z8H4_9FIRM|nr:YitT family protein [Anaeromonas frigoriresistens]